MDMKNGWRGEMEKGGGDFGRINEAPIAPSCSGGDHRQKRGNALPLFVRSPNASNRC